MSVAEPILRPVTPATPERPRPVMPDWTLDDLVAKFGPMPLRRIVFDPAPGTATEEDALRMAEGGRLCELVDGILIEKDMGYPQSRLALWIGHLLLTYLSRNNIGDAAGADATMRLMPGLVRIPDVSFTRWEKFPGRRVSDTPVPGLVPDLAVEVISKGNTKKELEDKLADYFRVGVRLVWYVRPESKTVEVYTAPDRCRTLSGEDVLDGGEVLPDFTLPLPQLFAERHG
jgi:Uma2 family endonuclease